MKKISIYSIIILCIGLSFIAWDFYQINDRFFNDRHYYKSSFDFTNAVKNQICVVKNENNKIRYFKIEGFTSDHRLCVRFGNKPSLIPLGELDKIIFRSDGTQIHMTHRWVSDISNDPTVWRDELTIISQKQVDDINANNKVYCYKSYYPRSEKPQPIYLIPFNLLLLLVEAVLIFFVLSVNYLFSNRKNIVTYIFIIAAAFLAARIFSYSYPPSIFNILFVKNLITFLTLYRVINIVNQKSKIYDFGKQELLKFFCIAIFGFFSELLGGRLFNFIYFDFLEFGGDTYYDFSSFSNVLGWFKFWIFFGVANFMSNLTFYIITLRKQEKIFKFQKSEGTLASSTLASIQSRINPHFLYNALNSIASLARTDPRKTEEMALQLAKFYDQCSDIKSKPMITLVEELEIINSYLKIEKIRFGNRIQVILPTDNDVMECMMPSFTLQPIVENAIKYGYNIEENVITIRITAESNGKSLILRIYDSGPPFSDNLHSGYGLSSIAKKLKVLYPERHTISFINEPEKCVEIVLSSEY